MGRILLAVGLAVTVTAALDATGFTLVSALPLIALFGIFAWLDRIPLKTLGFVAGRPVHYALALAHPLVVMALLAAIAQANGAMPAADFDPYRALKNVALMAGATFVMAIITEEGFFRGWLWAALGRRQATPTETLALTTVAFVLWHLPFVFLSDEFHFAQAQIPIFFVNVALLGLIWGLLRLGSGSILVSSAGHGLWNGMAYVLFGVGSSAGALGIENVGTYGPEVGLLGAALNAAFAACLWMVVRRQLRSVAAAEPARA
jgi:membrane protease YdiL (CAAX protease family)